MDDDDETYEDDDWPRYESKIDVVIAFITYAIIGLFAAYMYWQMFVREF
jgi:hypothetical protein